MDALFLEQQPRGVAGGEGQVLGLGVVVADDLVAPFGGVAAALGVIDGAFVAPDADQFLDAGAQQIGVAVAEAIIAEASLSFLGLGQQPPAPSWGSMLNSAQRFIENAPWLAIFPGMAIFTLVLALNLLGDGLRDALDPRSARR
jgi:ABC-type antimicrobial peptide transport system permease subunit